MSEEWRGSCPRCHHRLHVRGQPTAGARLTCPGCHTSFPIPDAPPCPPPAANDGRGTRRAALATGAGLVLLGGVALALTLSGSPPPKQATADDVRAEAVPAPQPEKPQPEVRRGETPLVPLPPSAPAEVRISDPPPSLPAPPPHLPAPPPPTPPPPGVKRPPIKWLPPEEQAKVDQAIERCVAWLRKQQRANGAWAGEGGLAGHNTPLVGLALLHSGVPANDPCLVRAAAYLRRDYATIPARPIVYDWREFTYALSLGILFLDRLGDPRDEPLIRRMTLRLLTAQMPTGGWGYYCRILSAEQERRLLTYLVKNRPSSARALFPADPRGTLPRGLYVPPGGPALETLPAWARTVRFGLWSADHSNTQFAVMALWAAARHGLPVERALAQAALHFRARQLSDGGWSYHLPPKGRDSSLSMTAAGLYALAVGHGLMAPEGAQTVADPALPRGLQWMARAIDDPKSMENSLGEAEQGKRIVDYYCLWSVERTAMLYNLRTIQARAWYPWGARMILAMQQADGHWPTDGRGCGPWPNTAFALLFLSRANVAPELSRQLRYVETGERPVLEHIPVQERDRLFYNQRPRGTRPSVDEPPQSQPEPPPIAKAQPAGKAPFEGEDLVGPDLGLLAPVAPPHPKDTMPMLDPPDVKHPSQVLASPAAKVSHLAMSFGRSEFGGYGGAVRSNAHGSGCSVIDVYDSNTTSAPYRAKPGVRPELSYHGSVRIFGADYDTPPNVLRVHLRQQINKELGVKNYEYVYMVREALAYNMRQLPERVTQYAYYVNPATARLRRRWEQINLETMRKMRDECDLALRKLKRPHPPTLADFDRMIAGLRDHKVTVRRQAANDLYYWLSRALSGEMAPDTRAAAIRKAVPVLRAVLEGDTDSEVFNRAGWTLREVGETERHLDLLLARCKFGWIRESAYEAVGRAAAQSQANMDKALPVLLAGLKSPDRKVRAAAEIGLTNAGPKAADALLKAIKEGHIEAAGALGEIRPVSDATVLALVSILSEGDGNARLAANHALVLLEKNAVPALVAALDKATGKTWCNIILTLGHIGAPAGAAVPVLEKALREDDERKRLVALGALARIAPDNAAVRKASATMVPRLLKGLEDDKAAVRAWAAQTLGDLGFQARGAAAALQRHLADADPLVRGQAALALTLVAPEVRTTVPSVIALLHDADQGVRRAAGAALVGLGRRAVPALIEAVQSGTPVRRIAAIEVLQHIGHDARKAIPVLKAALDNPNKEVRASAAKALAAVQAPLDHEK